MLHDMPKLIRDHVAGKHAGTHTHIPTSRGIMDEGNELL